MRLENRVRGAIGTVSHIHPARRESDRRFPSRPRCVPAARPAVAPARSTTIVSADPAIPTACNKQLHHDEVSLFTLGRSIGANETELDQIGIDVTRLNVRLLIAAIGDDAALAPARNYEAAGKALCRGDIVVMGGTAPSQTTNTERRPRRIRERRPLIYATSTPGVFRRIVLTGRTRPMLVRCLRWMSTFYKYPDIHN